MIMANLSCSKWLTLITLLLLSACTSTADKPPIYLDTQQDLEQRATDLVARMTLTEKISQMLNDAPAIERLGIEQYNWWSEALHGVARAGLATVFPQAIGLAATWDEDAMLRVATAISDEARAKHHAFAAKDKRFIYQGLTLWSPNINIFRDPRWGRGQETYGEDPLLTGRMAAQFIRGLQGDHPKYLKTVATVKHFAVHSGPEPERHSFDAVVDEQDLYDFYLPQFELAIKEAQPYSLMCAYNRYNGEPACASEFLLQKLLRERWQFDGFVVSDCGAIEDIHLHHQSTETAAQSAAKAVRAGTDLNCGKTYSNLLESVEQGLITESEIDTAVKRLMKARLKLGMFDPAEQVPYAQIPYSVVDSKAHRELALEATRKSMVLLKNEKQTLPFKKSLKSLAVIGPNADQWLMLLGNYNGVPADPITPLRGLREKLPNTQVLYAQGSELATGVPLLSPIPAQAFSTGDQAGLQVEFFDNSQLDGKAVISTRHANIDANWHDGSPAPSLDDDNFSVRWRAQLTPPETGEYQLGVISTCNTKVYLNGELVVSTPYHFNDEFGDPRTQKSSWLTLDADEQYDIEVTAIETYADAQVQLVWAKPQSNLLEEAIATAEQADAVVLAMGLTPRLEGEEMDINLEGFRGGDRSALQLPEAQQNLIKKITELGKPTVLVLLNGSAVAINWEQQNVPAILEAWYPGQAAGQAIADIIFGDYNPAGRLPVTFYRSVDDLPPFEQYEISKQTYRYFDGEALYPFGYGLSYSRFNYSQLNMPKQIEAEQGTIMDVSITNTSATDGEEVAQVYLSTRKRNADQALRQLVAFKRVFIAAGETQKVTFTIPSSAFGTASSKQNENGSREFQISVGGGQPIDTLNSTSNFVQSDFIVK